MTNALREFTPRELGIIAGLGDRWADNPWSVPDGWSQPWRATEYQVGFRIGQALLGVAKQEIPAE